MKKILFCVLLLAGIINGLQAQFKRDSIRTKGLLAVEKVDDAQWIKRFQSDIDKYTDENRKLTDRSCDALFLGSSTINLWQNIYADLAPLKIIRRSYGGATLRDMIYNYDVIARGYKPRQIVIYVENDLCGCKDAVTVGKAYDLYRLFVQKLLDEYTDVPVYILSYKPSIARLGELKQQQMLNQLLSDYAQETRGVYFLDITKGMYDAKGDLLKDIFKSDGLHMNQKGYDIWTSEIKSILMANVARQPYARKVTSTGKWNLVWDEEFDYVGLPDPVKWSFDTAGNKTGWGNNEDQYYTDRDSVNAWVSNGVLTITALQKKMYGKKYTSARIKTKGKGDWLYGRFEIRAKLPAGRGTWPAIWMLPTDWGYGGWPKSGELDIMENVGFMPDTLVFSVHTQAYNHIIHTQKTKRILYPGTSDDYHIYAMEWEKDQIRFYVDDNLALTVNNEHKTFAEWPFDKPFHMILNLAIGGFWGGEKGIDNRIFPCRFDVDYVRVYQSENKQ